MTTYSNNPRFTKNRYAAGSLPEQQNSTPAPIKVLNSSTIRLFSREQAEIFRTRGRTFDIRDISFLPSPNTTVGTLNLKAMLPQYSVHANNQQIDRMLKTKKYIVRYAPVKHISKNDKYINNEYILFAPDINKNECPSETLPNIYRMVVAHKIGSQDDTTIILQAVLGSGCEDGLFNLLQFQKVWEMETIETKPLNLPSEHILKHPERFASLNRDTVFCPHMHRVNENNSTINDFRKIPSTYVEEMENCNLQQAIEYMLKESNIVGSIQVQPNEKLIDLQSKFDKKLIRVDSLDIPAMSQDIKESNTQVKTVPSPYIAQILNSDKK